MNIPPENVLSDLEDVLRLSDWKPPGRPRIHNLREEGVHVELLKGVLRLLPELGVVLHLLQVGAVGGPHEEVAFRSEKFTALVRT